MALMMGGAAGTQGAHEQAQLRAQPEAQEPPKTVQDLERGAREAADAAAAWAEVQEKRDSVVAKLRSAAIAEDIDLLREAVAEAEEMGCAHEAKIGKRKLAALGVQYARFLDESPGGNSAILPSRDFP